MLKGHDKGSVGENIRELKSKGLSERDAVLVSMKNSKAEKKKMSSSPVSSGSYDDYPYGLRIDLNDDALDKLGLDSLPKVGETLELEAVVKVERTSEDASSDSGGKKRRSVCLQITKMKLE